MARYTGPVCKLCRREGIKLFLKGERCFTPKCAIERRNTPPGMHTARRRKTSEYGTQLREKQKAKRIYGLLEKQFQRTFDTAKRRPGLTGENMLRMLETRMDNVIYRLGFAESRAQARQLVTHGHFDINGHKLDIPSAQVKVGDRISVRERSRNFEHFKAAMQDIGRKNIPGWLSLDPATMTGQVVALPTKQDMDLGINEALIVEHYSR